MPGYHVHSFFTAALYDGSGRPVPAGLVDLDLPYAGALLFMSDQSQQIQNYDVYHTLSNVAMGPFSHAYVCLGKVHEVYASLPPMSEQNIMASTREVIHDERLRGMRALCGYGKPIHQMWAFAHFNGGLDLYVQTIGSFPPDVFVHYGLHIDEPSDWWRARSYEVMGVIHMPDWASRVSIRSAL